MYEILKIIDEYKKKSDRDLLILEVKYNTGHLGKVYLNRSSVERIQFEIKNMNKPMTEKMWEEYRWLVLEEERTERSFDEEY